MMKWIACVACAMVGGALAYASSGGGWSEFLLAMAVLIALA
jgi:hypothetical protein